MRSAIATPQHPDDIECMMAGTLLLLKRAGYVVTTGSPEGWRRNLHYGFCEEEATNVGIGRELHHQ